MGTGAALPDLEAMEAAELRTLVRAQPEREGTREAEIERLTLLLLKLQRMLFGRRSERVARQVEQLELQLEELQSEPRPRTWKPAPVAAEAGAGAEKPKRMPLPDDLPREVRRLEPAGSGCPSCGGELRRIGEDVSEVLDIVPARLRAIRFVRPKYACRGCERLVQAPAASRPIARGEATPALLAHVLVSKYGDHLPLYRQEAILRRSGVDLARSTLCGWVRECRDLLAPLSEALRQYVMAGGKVHADDTPVPVLAPGLGKTRTARMWAYVRDDRPAGSTQPPAAWFGYSPDRKGEHPARHLGSFRGTLQADGYAGFHAIYERGEVREAACWAHVRRKFHDLEIAHHSPLAAEALRRIGELYGIEEAIRGRPPEERFAARQNRARPLLDDLRVWLETTLRNLSAQSETARAVRYALGAWTALGVYCGDGAVEIDNNAVERELRAVALGRKNYLFAGSDRGGESAAGIYGLIATAKLNGLDPEAYLREVLDRINDQPIHRIADLLPWHLAPRLNSSN